ncbi:GntR family transcriptional regulator [Pusillimonas sp. ANT_WB101]|uniref:GntR family transcriptional regulator n=1 Tax=Pusillimonas sp. ANT_WB101 TaxID=2597356 RepID=UPI0011ECFAF4|nr:GntR family transcriptional regulator [Pusillimonas sp. ANT_WB101]KAA0911300.1 GntR family transcriptional regulator [Pusillimonas sp. ANT_WB101]
MSDPSSSQTAMSRSRQPLYLQLATEFQRNLDVGVWPVGHQIPPLEELMQTYKVSRMTLRNALGVLEADGLISRVRGKGTFVEKRKHDAYSLNIPTSWDETVALSDVLGTHRFVESERTVKQLPAFNMVCKGTPAPAYQHLRRLHSSDGVPYCYSEVYVDNALFKQHKRAFLKQAAASVIARVPGLKISESRQHLAIINAGFESANVLLLRPGESVAEVTRFACANGVIIYYARLEFPTKFVKLELDLLAR